MNCNLATPPTPHCRTAGRGGTVAQNEMRPALLSQPDLVAHFNGKRASDNEQSSHYGRRAPSTRGERMTPRETPANTGGCAGLTKAELIVRAANVRGNPEHVRACVRSMRLLISQTDDEAIADWRDAGRWEQLSNIWRQTDPDRTTAEAREHCDRVCKILGARRGRRSAA